MPSIVVTALGLFILSGTSVITNAAAVQPTENKIYTVAVTGYNAVPEQTDGDPKTTASGAFSNPDIVAARSADLADELPFGTVIEILPLATTTPNCGLSNIEPFLGFRVVADTMHSRKRNQVDILFDSDVSHRVGGKSMNPAVTLGKCSGVNIRVVGHIDTRKMPKSQIELMSAIGLPVPLTVRK